MKGLNFLGRDSVRKTGFVGFLVFSALIFFSLSGGLSWGEAPATRSSETRARGSTATKDGGKENKRGGQLSGKLEKRGKKIDAVQRAFAEDFVKNYWSKGPLLGFILIFFAGFLVSLTPCVYPMIPITVAIIAGSAGKEKKRGRGFLLATLYVIGMAIPYTALGVVVALLGSQPFVLGTVFNSPFFLLFLIFLFGAMALSMAGAFTISLPPNLQNRLARFEGKGKLGVIVLGMIGALLATPCSGPVIVGILAFVALTGNVILGAAIPTVFTLGIGVPFLVLGGGVVEALPKGGRWTEEVKKLFALILAAAAFYYSYLLVYKLWPNQMGIFSFALGSFAIWLGVAAGAFRTPCEKTILWDQIKQAFGIISILIGVYLIGGTLVQNGFIHPPVKIYSWERSGFSGRVGRALGAQNTSAGGGSVARVAESDPCLPPRDYPGEQLYWLKSEKLGVSCAKKYKKPMMIDFWAEWCAACKELDKKSFNDPKVRAELQKRFILVKHEYREEGPEDERLQKKYGIRGLPWVRFVGSDGKLLDTPIIVGFKSPEEVLEILKKVK